jgi:hypothetical protein
MIISVPLPPSEAYMNATRLGALLLGSFLLLPGLLQAHDNKEGFPKVTLDELKKDPDKYQGQVVQIEGILAADPVSSERTQVQRFYLRIAEAGGLGITSYMPPPDVLKGDKVRITGTFRYSKNGSNPVTLLLRLENKDGKIEKLPKE